jgi:hypothetical protein
MGEARIPDVVRGWMVNPESFHSFVIESGLSGYMDSVREKTIRNSHRDEVLLEQLDQMESLGIRQG